MTAPSGWATQQLAEFLAVVTAAADEKAAVRDALERLAESFEADAGAFLQNGCVTASLGGPGGAPTAELVAAGNNDRTSIDLSGVGRCEAVAIPVDGDAGTTLILARADYRFSRKRWACSAAWPGCWPSGFACSAPSPWNDVTSRRTGTWWSPFGSVKP